MFNIFGKKKAFIVDSKGNAVLFLIRNLQLSQCPGMLTHEYRFMQDQLNTPEENQANEVESIFLRSYRLSHGYASEYIINYL